MEIKVLYEDYRPLLFTLAYQLTGTVSDAEDAVQDVFVKLHGVDVEVLEEPKAYLCKMVSNRCLDYLKSARKKREQYVGIWLPEPVRTTRDDISEIIVTNDLLSYAMLVLMESLNPVERVVFVLKEAFHFDYVTIAGIVDKSEANCRKIVSRNRGKLSIQQNETKSLETVNSEWTHDLIRALKQGNVEKLLPLLSEDITVYSDGGGKVPAAIHPIKTPEKVLRFLMGLIQRLPQYGEDARILPVVLNGQDGIVVMTNKEVVLASLFHLEGSSIQNIYFIRNPDKLHVLSKELL